MLAVSVVSVRRAPALVRLLGFAVWLARFLSLSGEGDVTWPILAEDLLLSRCLRSMRHISFTMSGGQRAFVLRLLCFLFLFGRVVPCASLFLLFARTGGSGWRTLALAYLLLY